MKKKRKKKRFFGIYDIRRNDIKYKWHPPICVITNVVII